MRVCQKCYFIICYSEQLHEGSYLVKISRKIETNDYIIFHKLGLVQHENLDHGTTNAGSFSQKSIFNHIIYCHDSASAFQLLGKGNVKLKWIPHQ